MLVLALITLVLHGALTGLFYAFSMSVMPGLNAIDPAQAESAMRSVNQKIQNVWLFLVFIGSPLAALVSGFLADGMAATWFFAAAGVNFVGSFLVTVAINVPMNNALDAGTMAFKDYSPRWTAFNTLRTVACAAGLVLVGLGLTAL
ncbi:putative membrane protein [Nonomuraea thailandensis]|uniref:Membrane protein n=1 Tax=Nonomuraea thailandensis TaxID=1188745 RepID=A0A9X2GUM5_9ACTN|nr:anthrone oxygenase family protein [Nonomuraea thailandensis]MCP2364084.1 putative membrane protein [Nonomuraea thailandensis]